MTKDEVKKLRMNSPESLQFLNNATKFYNLMMMYRCAIREIQTKLEVLDDEFSVENNRNPISFIKTRIKKPNSIYDKLQKMGYEFTTENIQTYLNDVAGVRIVCAFIDDIYMISDLITQQDDIKVIEIKDYIKKERSLNLSHKSSLYLKQTHKDYAQNQTTEKTDNISKNHLPISPFTACLPDVII